MMGLYCLCMENKDIDQLSLILASEPTVLQKSVSGLNPADR